MTALERVQEKAREENLVGQVRKEYHKMLFGYWLFSPDGKYLGSSEEVACHMIAATRLYRSIEKEKNHD